jgi:hypothetical protein
MKTKPPPLFEARAAAIETRSITRPSSSMRTVVGLAVLFNHWRPTMPSKFEPSTPSGAIKLANLAPYLRSRVTEPDNVPGYRRFYRDVLDGRLPASARGSHRDRWVDLADVPAIAAKFGLTLRTDRSAA